MIQELENLALLEVAKSILIVIIILALTFVFAKIVKVGLKRVLKKSAKLTKTEPERYSFLLHLTTGFIYLFGIIIAVYSIPYFRTVAVSLLAGAGIIAVVIGFASQQAFSNIVSGVMIAIFKPIRVGDRVKIGIDIAGVVEDITLRHTVIRSFENKRLIMPNSKISEETIENSNYSDEKVCRFVKFGISYDSDIDLAIRIMRKEAEKHPLALDNRSKKEKEEGREMITVRVLGFSDSSVNLRAWVWAKNPADSFTLGCDLNKSIKERFDKEGVEIPFPYRTIVYKKDIPSPKKDQKVKKRNLKIDKVLSLKNESP